MGAPAPEGAKVKPLEIWTKKYLERARAGKALYEVMIKQPRRDPIKAAISMRSTLEAKMADKSTWDKWQEKLEGIGFEGWLDATLNKGVPRFVPGIEYGFKYYKAFAEQFSKHLEEGLKKVLAMPKRTLDESIARAAEMIRHNAKFRFKKTFVK